MGDRIFKWVARSAALIFVAIVVAIAVMLLVQAWPALQRAGFSFVTTSIWNPVKERFGILPLIYGTVTTSLLALLISAPIGVGIAIFLTEISASRLRTVVAFLVELLAAIPSVILGLWGIMYLVPFLREVIEPWFIDHFGYLPIFEGPPYGIGLFAAAVILAIMVIPIVAAISREVLRAVPREQREAAYALGATRWEVIRYGVLSYAKSGIIGAIFLGFGRALGETMAVTMVIGNSARINWSLFAPANTMASVLANEFTEATSDAYVSALIGVALMLFVVTCIINGLARVLVARMRMVN